MHVGEGGGAHMCVLLVDSLSLLLWFGGGGGNVFCVLLVDSLLPTVVGVGGGGGQRKNK